MMHGIGQYFHIFLVGQNLFLCYKDGGGGQGSKGRGERWEEERAKGGQKREWRRLEWKRQSIWHSLYSQKQYLEDPVQYQVANLNNEVATHNLSINLLIKDIIAFIAILAQALHDKFAGAQLALGSYGLSVLRCTLLRQEVLCFFLGLSTLDTWEWAPQKRQAQT